MHFLPVKIHIEIQYHKLMDNRLKQAFFCGNFSIDISLVFKKNRVMRYETDQGKMWYRGTLMEGGRQDSFSTEVLENLFHGNFI